VVFFIGFSTVFISTYFLLKVSIISSIDAEKNPLVVVAVIEEFNLVWLEIALISFIVFLIIFFILKRNIKTLTNDIDEFTEYLEEINQKKYNAVLKINHYVELLKMSLLLKNIVKRLNKKAKK